MENSNFFGLYFDFNLTKKSLDLEEGFWAHLVLVFFFTLIHIFKKKILKKRKIKRYLIFFILKNTKKTLFF